MSASNNSGMEIISLKKKQNTEKAEAKAAKAAEKAEAKAAKAAAKAQRTKAKAGANETEDINFIIDAIHTKNAAGLKLINGFKAKLGDTLLDARVRTGSNRKTHYDFETLVRFTNGTESWKRVEHKGASANVTIKEGEKPWLAGVQFHNGGCEKYTIAKTYAQIWYDIHIASGALTKAWDLASPIPTFDDWWKNCCIQQSCKPKVPFILELKNKVRAKKGKKGSLTSERNAVVDAFMLANTQEMRDQLIKEVLPIVKEAFDNKDYWLTIRGLLKSGDFDCAWNPQSTISTINSVSISKKTDSDKGSDILCEFYCTDNFKFNGLLRFGAGAGFGNIRLDLK